MCVLALWILKDYQNLVWVKEIISEMPRDATHIQALCTIHTGELAINFNGHLNLTFRLHLYNMKSKRFRILDFDFPEFMIGDWDRLFKLVTNYD